MKHAVWRASDHGHRLGKSRIQNSCPARSNIRFHYADGKWDDGTLTGSYDITVSVAANAFHYGQAIFEGGKAFRCKDGKVRIFRPEENGRRLNRSASHLLMPEFPVDKFVEAVKTVVRDNADFVPPYGTGGALYIRPVMSAPRRRSASARASNMS